MHHGVQVVKALDWDTEVPGSSPTIEIGIFSAQKSERCILKVFSQTEFYTASFGGDVKLLAPGDLD